MENVHRVSRAVCRDSVKRQRTRADSAAVHECALSVSVYVRSGGRSVAIIMVYSRGRSARAGTVLRASSH